MKWYHQNETPRTRAQDVDAAVTPRKGGVGGWGRRVVNSNLLFGGRSKNIINIP